MKPGRTQSEQLVMILGLPLLGDLSYCGGVPCITGLYNWCSVISGALSQLRPRCCRVRVTSLLFISKFIFVYENVFKAL